MLTPRISMIQTEQQLTFKRLQFPEYCLRNDNHHSSIAKEFHVMNTGSQIVSKQ